MHDLLFLSVSISPHTYFRECTHLFVCYVCVSNDAVGHDRRWHLILMVTPAHGGPCGRAPGKEKLRGRRRDTHQRWHQYTRHRGKNTQYCHSGTANGNVLIVSSFLIIYANLKGSFQVQPQEYRSLFVPLLENTFWKRFWGSSSVTVNVL